MKGRRWGLGEGRVEDWTEDWGQADSAGRTKKAPLPKKGASKLPTATK